eukprot:TRINITY_DN9149_c0_g1_i2.p1 TRINITY_DN9149_c0_g1~~TRINITY_DN9149_c0_g1_i2.p1  ORF type:complete len:285 (-),score=59.22 TRINITY_DN9149_c0_g1_i2:104-958(-)
MLLQIFKTVNSHVPYGSWALLGVIGLILNVLERSYRLVHNSGLFLSFVIGTSSFVALRKLFDKWTSNVSESGENEYDVEEKSQVLIDWMLWLVRLSIALFVSVLAMMQWEIQYGRWCTVPAWKRDLLCDEAHLFVKILEHRNITHWLSDGDAIAVLRGGELIPWEWDVDISIDVSERHRMTDIIQNDLAFPVAYKNIGSFYYPAEKKYRHESFKQTKYHPFVDTFYREAPSSGVSKARYCKGKSFFVRNDMEEYVRRTYGNDYLIPRNKDKVSNWLFCSIYWWA